MNESEDNSDNALSLETLPVEVFLHICSFLEAKFLTDSLRVVCKRFYNILTDESIWKSRFKKRWSCQPVPLMEFCGTSGLTWSELCANVEVELNLWTIKRENMISKVWRDKHYSCVDAVKLLNKGRILASGSRDRTLALWDVVSGSDNPIAHCITAHTGWIWKLAVHDDSLYSCSWDSCIKLWRYDPTLQEVSTFVCSGAVLSIACRQQLIAAGLFTTRIMLFDPRCKDSIGDYSPHRLAITALALSGDYCVVSASEDKTVAVWDIRTYKPVMNNLKVSCKNSFPMSMCYRDNLLYVGDNHGCLHVISNNEGVFEKRGVFQLVTQPYHKLTSVWHGRGCIVTGSTDKSVRVFTPTQPPELIATLNDRVGEVAAIDYCSPVLAVGCTDNSVEVWHTVDAFI